MFGPLTLLCSSHLPWWGRWPPRELPWVMRLAKAETSFEVLNGVLWSVSYTKRIHLLCEVPLRDLCEPRKTSKRKLSYRFWKESWCIYFPILQQRSSVFFQQYSPFLLSGLAGLAPERMGTPKGFSLPVSRCVGMKAERNQAYSNPQGPPEEAMHSKGQSVPNSRGWVLVYLWKGEQARKCWAVKKLNNQCFCVLVHCP